MKAIFFEKHGDSNVLQYGDLPQPVPKEGEALIKVKAVALNHLDIWVRRGWKGLELNMPHIGGSDVSGELVSVKGATPFKVGSRVVINPGVSTSEDEWTRRGEHSLSPNYQVIGEHIPGGLAEYCTVPIKNLMVLPENISFEAGAAPLLVATTSWRMLFNRAQLTPADSILVVGSGGGVNSLTIQIAHSLGAKVFALAGSPEKAEQAQKIGADEVIEYNKFPAWHKEILKMTSGRGVDVVVDNVGEKTLEMSLKAVARGGRVVTVGNTTGYNIKFDNRLLFSKQISLIGSTMGSPQDFIDAMAYLWRNKIEIAIDSVSPLSKGIEMLERLERGDHFGKIVLQPRSSFA